LTIPSDAVLDVDGTVLVGGVRMYAGQNALQGHTSGAYSQIINNGTIALDGDMEIYGLVKGNGTFTAAAESEILEPFVLVDYAGGTNTMALFETGKQFPFGQFCFANIQCDLTMYQGAELKGIAGIFALGGLHEVSGVGVVGSSENASDAMIQLGEGGVMHHSLDTSKFFTVTKSGKSAAIPKSVLKLTGNAGIGTMALSVEGVGSFSSADIYLGLPYNFDVTLDDGDFEIADGVKCRILPGSCVTIEDGAVLTVKEALMVYDGLHDEYGRAGIVYPWENQLTEAGFASSGMLTVNGTLVLADGSSFGGVIQTGGRSGKISVGENVTLNSNIQFGCESVDVSMGGTSQNNLAFHDLSARIRMRNGSLVMLQNGKEYKAVGNTAWELTSYAEQRTSDTAMNVYEKALPQAMKGVWAENNGEEILLGDVNLDNEVDAADLTALARHVAKIQTLKDEAALANADVTGEGELDAADLTKLARYVAKIISQL